MSEQEPHSAPVTPSIWDQLRLMTRRTFNGVAVKLAPFLGIPTPAVIAKETASTAIGLPVSDPETANRVKPLLEEASKLLYSGGDPQRPSAFSVLFYHYVYRSYPECYIYSNEKEPLNEPFTVRPIEGLDAVDTWIHFVSPKLDRLDSIRTSLQNDAGFMEYMNQLSSYRTMPLQERVDAQEPIRKHFGFAHNKSNQDEHALRFYVSGKQHYLLEENREELRLIALRHFFSIFSKAGMLTTDQRNTIREFEKSHVVETKNTSEGLLSATDLRRQQLIKGLGLESDLPALKQVRQEAAIASRQELPSASQRLS